MDSFSRLCYPVNGALLCGEQRSIRPTVMNQIMHILAEHFIEVFVSQSAKAGRVAERASVFEINSINGFGGGVEKKSKFVLTLAQRLFRPLALGDVLQDNSDSTDARWAHDGKVRHEHVSLA